MHPVGASAVEPKAAASAPRALARGVGIEPSDHRWRWLRVLLGVPILVGFPEEILGPFREGAGNRRESRQKPPIGIVLFAHVCGGSPFGLVP